MKKLKFLLLGLFGFAFLITNVYAECDSNEIEELREWATKAEVKFTLSPENYSNKYAYFLSVTPEKEGVIVEVEDAYGNKAKAKKFEDINLYGVGCYTNLEETTYTVRVYSECSNELLKTMKHTVPRLNRMIKNEVCAKYPDHELCQTFTNKTKDMTEQQFLKKMNEYDQSQQKTSFGTKILQIIREYGIFILIPFLLITLVYIIKVQEFKKKERKK